MRIRAGHLPSMLPQNSQRLLNRLNRIPLCFFGKPTQAWMRIELSTVQEIYISLFILFLLQVCGSANFWIFWMRAKGANQQQDEKSNETSKCRSHIPGAHIAKQ